MSFLKLLAGNARSGDRSSVPYKVPTSKYGVEFVHGDWEVADGLQVIVLYTVPPGKRLYVLNASLSSGPEATTNTPIRVFLYIWKADQSDGMEIITHNYKCLAALQDQVRSDTAGPIEVSFPADYSIRCHIANGSSAAGSFIGVLVRDDENY